MYEHTPHEIVHDLLTKAIFGNHPLGYPILGTEDTLATFTKDMLKEYMYNTYTPDKVVISIAGNVDDAFIYEVKKRFGYYEGGKRKENYRKPVFHKDRRSVQRKPNRPIFASALKDMLPAINAFIGYSSSIIFSVATSVAGSSRKFAKTRISLFGLFLLFRL